MLLYDSKNKRLIYIENKPTAKFWDKLWEDQTNTQNPFIKKIDLIVTPTTKKYLKPKSRILEGGCGHGTYVQILNSNGYNCIGVDFAKETVKRLNQKYPKTPIIYGDLTSLPFKNNSFDGYWSLGVIEHFYNGFAPVLSEMKRVTKKGGYAFVSFPYMSPLRKFKARLGLYELQTKTSEPKNFYQFALNHETVISIFKKSGFKLQKQKPYDGFSGLKKEISQLNFLLDPIAQYSTKILFVAGIRFVISKLVEKFTSHSILLVFQKDKG